MMTQRWIDPQSEMMSQHHNHFANTAGILVLHKGKSRITQIKDADPMLFYAGPTLYRMDQL